MAGGIEKRPGLFPRMFHHETTESGLEVYRQTEPQISPIVTLDMVRPGDLVQLYKYSATSATARFATANAVYLTTENRYRWPDLTLDDGNQTLEFMYLNN